MNNFYLLTLGPKEEYEAVEIWKGVEEITTKSLNVLAQITTCYDLCLDSTGPVVILSQPLIRNAYYDLKKRGIPVRIITEVTKENLDKVRELMGIAEIRHLDNIIGNFVIADKSKYAGSPETENGTLTKLISCTVRTFVRQQQYFFDMLWNRAKPAEYSIEEIQGSRAHGKTEILYGSENAVGKGVEFMKNVKTRMDIYFDRNAPSIVIEVSDYRQGYVDIRKRGGKIRALTEITKDNLPYCKELIKIVDELRHLDSVRGGVAVSEREFMATTILEEAKPLAQVIYSDAMEVVQQGQLIFETLWEKAIPGALRIREIEHGIQPERIEIIQDIQKSIGRAFEIFSKTKKELLVLFATSHTFSVAMSMNSAQLYKKMTDMGVKVRILVPKKEEKSLAEAIERTKRIAPEIDLRISDAALNTRLTILVADRKEYMSWELRDDTSDDPYLAGGVATYCSIESLATSYATIFDNLWILTEFAENLRMANVKLENNEKAMREFINIAAHELRTPIQPILGLSEVLQGSHKGSFEQQNLLEIIIRNAHRLERLAEDILDVTRIESGKLQLSREEMNLYELVQGVVNDIQRSVGNRITIIIDSFDNGRPSEEQNLFLRGDQGRLIQVISNLLSNAVKFSRDGEIIRIRIGTQASPTRKNREEAIIAISDQGSGIDPEIMPRLFEKFASKSDQGTGLGLYLSKKIVEAHGGDIWAENNKDGKGATFGFSLPIYHD